ncbi:hypothetical protein E3N88_38487 [Mikania micrantha]|uniref:CCHC-type domain-containing protein n=1 Tax=Mikania micrantha TaxID=192012 RepID=A0A5N6LUE5_9ASTR|nr:hypothetical protein E3N88_38487 [Mikania micrantha]
MFVKLNVSSNVNAISHGPWDQNTDNHDEMCYIQEKHKAWIENPSYACCRTEDGENIGTQKRVGKRNQILKVVDAGDQVAQVADAMYWKKHVLWRKQLWELAELEEGEEFYYEKRFWMVNKCFGTNMKYRQTFIIANMKIVCTMQGWQKVVVFWSESSWVSIRTLGGNMTNATSSASPIYCIQIGCPRKHIPVSTALKTVVRIATTSVVTSSTRVPWAMELNKGSGKLRASKVAFKPLYSLRRPEITHMTTSLSFMVSTMSRDRTRSPGLAKRFRSRDRASYRDAPYKRDKPAYRQDYLCNKCRRPGHFARDCPNATVCNNCGLPGHISAECTSTTMCWNCKESGHVSSECPNEPVCHMCGKIGHLARDCHSPNVSSYDARLCNNCYKPGHVAAECTNEKACNNCRKTGHLARDCHNDPICNICSISGHVARQCPKSGSVKPGLPSFLGPAGSSLRDDPFRDMICRNCGRPGHISRDCVHMVIICTNCGGRGHLDIECPSARVYNSFDAAFFDPRFHRY